MADEMIASAPVAKGYTIENKITVTGMEQLQKLAAALESISRGSDINKYWKEQEDLVSDLTDMVKKYSESVDSINGTKLINTFRALSTVAGEDGLGEIVSNLQQIKPLIDDAVSRFGKLPGVIGENAFTNAFSAFDSLLNKADGIRDAINGWAPGDQLQAQIKKVQELEAALYQSQMKVATLNEKIENYESGDEFARLGDEIDSLRSKLEYLAQEATKEFTGFLDMNGIDHDNWMVENLFQDIEEGTSTSVEAIAYLRRHMDYLGDTSVDTSKIESALDKLTEKLENALTTFEEVSRYFAQGGTGTAVGDATLKMFPDAESIREKTESMSDLESASEYLKAMFENLAELSKSSSAADGGVSSANNLLLDLLGTVQQIVSQDTTSIENFANSLLRIMRLDDVKVSKTVPNNLSALFGALKDVPVSSLVALGNVSLNGFSDVKVSKASMNNLATYLPQIAAVNVQNLLKLSKVDLSSLGKVEIKKDALDGVKEVLEAADTIKALQDVVNRSDGIATTSANAGKNISSVSDEIASSEAEAKKNAEDTNKELINRESVLKRISDMLRSMRQEADKNFSAGTPGASDINDVISVLESTRQSLLSGDTDLSAAKEIIATAAKKYSEYREAVSATATMEKNIADEQRKAEAEANKLYADNNKELIQRESILGRMSSLLTSMKSADKKYGDSGVAGADSLRDAITNLSAIRNAFEAGKIGAGEASQAVAEATAIYGKYRESVVFVADEMQRSEAEAKKNAEDTTSALIERERLLGRISSLLKNMSSSYTEYGEYGADSGKSFGKYIEDLSDARDLFNENKISASEVRYYIEEAARAYSEYSEEVISSAKAQESAVKSQTESKKILTEMSKLLADMSSKNAMYGDSGVAGADSLTAYIGDIETMRDAVKNGSDVTDEMRSKILNAKVALAEFNEKVVSSVKANAEAEKAARAYNKALEEREKVEDRIKILQAGSGGNANFDSSGITAFEGTVKRLNDEFQQGKITQAQYVKGLNDAVAAYSKYEKKLKDAAAAERTARTSKNASLQTDEAKGKALKRLEQEYDVATKALKEYSYAENSPKSSNAYKAIQTAVVTYDELRKKLQDNVITKEKFNDEFGKTSSTVATAINEIKKVGDAHKTLSQQISEAISNFGQWFSITRIVMGAVRSIKQMVSAVIELDDALTQLQIVTKASDEEMENYAKSSIQTAKELGGSIKDIISSATTYARLGFSIEESDTLSRLTTMLQGVGDINVEDAQKAITAIVKAYDKGANDLEDVMDKLVAVGNNAPISVAELAEGMNNAGSALAASGNSFEQSVALLTASNSVIQNISKSSTGLRTIVARLRHTKAELDDLGESMTNVEYDSIVQALTGYEVSLTDANGNLRNTYDILKDIAGVAQRLKETDVNAYAALAEKLAGNRQQNIFYSLVENFSEAEAAIELMEKAPGELEAAYDTYLNSATAHINRFKAAWQEVAYDLIDSSVISDIADVGSALIGVLDSIVNITNAVGGLKTVMLAITSFVAVKEADRIFANIEKAIEGIAGFGGKITEMFGAMTGAQAGMLGVSVAVMALLAAMQLVTYEAEKQKRALDQFNKTKAAYEETAKKISDLNEKQAETSARYEELLNLSNSGKISFVETEELEKLKEANGELEIEIARLKELKLLQNADAIKDLNNAFELESFVSIDPNNTIDGQIARIDELRKEYAILEEARDKAMSGEGGLWTAEDETRITQLSVSISMLEDQIGSHRNTFVGFEDHVGELLQRYEELSKLASSGEQMTEAQKTQLNTTRAMLLDAMSTLKETYIDGIEGYSNDVWNSLYDSISRVLYPTEYLETKLATLPSEIRDRFKEIGSQGNLTAKDVEAAAESFSDLSTWMTETGVSSLEVANYFNQVATSVQEVDNSVSTAYEDIAGLIDGAKDISDVISKANDDMATSGELSMETVKSITKILSEAGQDVADYLYVENGLLKLNTQAWKEFGSADILKRIESIKNELNYLEDERQNYEALIDLGNQYNELVNGNVDYNLRPHISSEQMIDAGWTDFSGSVATTYTQGFTLGEAEAFITVDVTPILEDGTVLSPEALADYINKLDVTNGVEGLLASDYLNIVVNAVPGDYDPAYWDQLEGKLSEIKEKYETLYDGMPIEEHTEDVDALTSKLAILSEIYTQIAGGMTEYEIAMSGFTEVSTVITSVSTSLATVADIQKEVANGFTISLEKALEFAKAYPEILNEATASADGQITLNEAVVNSFIDGKEAELRGSVSAKIEELEASKSVLEAKRAFAQTQIDIAEEAARSESHIDKMNAINKIALGNETVKKMIDAGATEVEAYELASAAMSGNVNEFDRIVASVAENIANNLGNAATSSATNMYNNMKNASESVNSLMDAAHETAKAIAGMSKGQVRGTKKAFKGSRGSRAGGSYTTVGDTFDGVGFSPDGIENVMSLIDQLNLELEEIIQSASADVAVYEGAISQINGQIAALEGVLNKELSDFEGYGSTNNSGSSGGSSGSSSSDKSKENNWFKEQLAEHKHLVAMEQETQEEYIDWLDDAYKKAYEQGIISLDDFRKYEEEVFNARKEKPSTDNWFKEDLARFQHLVAMEQKTQAEYLRWLDVAYKQAYKEGIITLDEFRKYEEEVYSGTKKVADEAKSATEKLVQIRVKMLQDELKKEKDILNERLDALKEFYDNQKSLLREQASEEDYNKQHAEKIKSVSDIEMELAMLSLDRSAWADKRRLELTEELNKARSELEDFERDHTISEAEKELDRLYEDQKAALDAEIEALDAQIENARSLYEMALEDIKNGSVNLYEEMIRWNAEYGDGIDDTITKAWESAYDALHEYMILYGKAFDGFNLKPAPAGSGNSSGRGYSSGTKNSTRGLHRIDEVGGETIFESANGNKYRMFSDGEMVLNSSASRFLYDFATKGGAYLKNMFKSFAGSGLSIPTVNNQMIPAITMGDIIINGNASEATVSQIRRAQRESLNEMLNGLKKLSR